MRKARWLFALAVIACLVGGTASAQTFNANQLCIHNGAEYYTNGGYFGFPNWAAGRYFPSYAHWTSTPYTNLSGVNIYPWKLAGWTWSGMMGNITGSTWYWETALQKSMDNPYNINPTGGFDMSFDYPLLFCNGSKTTSGGPRPVYGITIPSSVPIVANYRSQCPSSMGGWDAYMNFFVTVGASFTVPSTNPFGMYTFAINWPCASAITVPSSSSIWEITWCQKGPTGQYNLLSGNEVDCLGGTANSGRNYSITIDADNGRYWYWNNTGAGTDNEWAVCLFVCDAITIPVNVPGTTPNNPYNLFGFDVGIGALLPKLSTNCVQLGFFTEDYTGLGGSRVALASFAFWPCVGPYGKFNYRVPHGWNVLASLFLNLAPVFIHTPAPGMPAGMFGTCVGGYSSTFLPFPADPALMCAEIRYSSYAMGKGQPMSASWMVTYF